MTVYSLAARCATEIIGTAAGVYVGEASIANALLPSAKGQGMGFGWIAFAYALAFFFPALFFGHISAILNPAFCLGLVVTGDLSAREFFALSCAEILGGFLGGVLVWVHWIPHLKTVPEPPPACEQDHLIRKRDSITKCGVQIASYNTQPDRSTRRSLGLLGCFRDIIFYLSHHHLPDTLPFAHQRSKGSGGGDGTVTPPGHSSCIGRDPVHLTKEELHFRLCKEEQALCDGQAPLQQQQQQLRRRQQADVQLHKLHAAGSTKQPGTAAGDSLGRAAPDAKLGADGGRQQDMQALAAASAARGSLDASSEAGSGAQHVRGASPPGTPAECRTPFGRSSLQALLAAGTDPRMLPASCAAAAGRATESGGGDSPSESSAAAAAAGSAGLRATAGQEGSIAAAGQVLSPEQLQQRHTAQQAYQAALLADQNIKLSIFATRPAIYAPFFNFVVEFLSTILLVAGIMLIQRHCDTIRYSDPLVYGVYTNGLSPFFVGLWVVVLVLGAGGPTGLAVNPARDLGPRMAFAVLPIPNKGPTEWHYAWIPVVAPLLGGACGGALADALRHLR